MAALHFPGGQIADRVCLSKRRGDSYFLFAGFRIVIARLLARDTVLKKHLCQTISYLVRAAR